MATFCKPELYRFQGKKKSMVTLETDKTGLKCLTEEFTFMEMCVLADGFALSFVMHCP